MRTYIKLCSTACTSALLLLSGCTTVGPDYQKPDKTLGNEWKIKDPALVPAKEAPVKWWNVFDDPVLNKLILMAEKNSYDIAIASARVKEARALLGIVSGAELPAIGANGSANRNRQSDALVPVNNSSRSVFSGGVDASWEIDLFGRISREVESATASYQASEEDFHDVMTTVYAEVARNYLGVKTLQVRLEVVNANIESQKKVIKLTRSRFENGLASSLDVAQSEQLLATSEALIHPLKIQLGDQIRVLSILLGQQLDEAILEQLNNKIKVPTTSENLTVGVPANILRQRPDIRLAERKLAAQTARIGVATAELYPSLSLTGSLAYISTDSVNFFNSGNRAYGFGPSLRWNIFQGGRLRSQIKAEDARTQQALHVYEKTVLAAITEVEQALYAYTERIKQLEAQAAAVDAAKHTFKLAERLYKDGLTDFQNVLDAERSLLSIEDQLTAVQGEVATAVINIYKAIGGGWNPSANETNKDNEISEKENEK